MKIIFTIIVLSGLLIFSSTETKAQNTTPPTRVNVKFSAKYPGFADKASWQQTSEGYTATFNDGGRETVSRYSAEGRWLGTRTQVTQKDWTPTMRRYLDENHKGYEYLEGYRFEDPKGSRYQLDVQNQNGSRYRLDFDQGGNFVNEGPVN